MPSWHPRLNMPQSSWHFLSHFKVLHLPGHMHFWKHSLKLTSERLRDRLKLQQRPSQWSMWPVPSSPSLCWAWSSPAFSMAYSLKTHQVQKLDLGVNVVKFISEQAYWLLALFAGWEHLVPVQWKGSDVERTRSAVWALQLTWDSCWRNPRSSIKE